MTWPRRIIPGTTLTPTALPGLASGTGNIWKLLNYLTPTAEISLLPAIMRKKLPL